ncbi:GNAT family N-acetyltransferase [Erwinia sp. OLTSP20]|uniref:GNAT family N-acetyltransferase n=1 Tax=unclassified Erwinia TaxID=2622719 RepID=UPI000C1A8718|nr:MULTISPECIES: GNAT family N-acetyltransferase [unclassified Erwinia]PIJ49004.1 GNAT family N-acetyltransferase [Erwinia sp. OAMSP11]PIJ74998.1 GNAT family N-acetyltransferase [Erwinia sp. OLSSP12]PIJ79689.1 GNAT family N-acetyltransferase [Erwinia sp. OLCASP19]PIJ80474.1 GNAT family N-acetyltransferase [Erwinia sp. OLMTSP26]PIJ82589.1 GNAT family N-acetyltransferase [Erwinia sp. OLMDSP33]
MADKRWRILPLNTEPHYRDAVVEWQSQAFGNETSREFFASVVDSSLRGADLPVTWIAVDGERVIGTIGLWRCDLISRQDLWPWLAALYVDPAYRGQGVSERLQQRVINEASARGFSNLYLWASFADYYERFGWQYLGEALDYPNKKVRVYRRAL